MGKKIIVLNGSPRLDGNTKKLITAFIKGAKEAGHEVTEFHLTKLKINPCLGCMQGGKDEACPCVQRDGMQGIYPQYIEADIMVWASPLYYWQISGQLKCTIDRLFAVAELNQYKNPPKEVVLLMTADGKAFEDVLVWYERLANRSVKWNSIGKIVCGNLHGTDQMEGRKEIQEAYELGKSL